MGWREDLQLTGTALKNWFIARCWDAVGVAVLWFVGLKIIGIPLAPLWAVVGGLLQFIPNFGPMLALIGPAFTAAIVSGFKDFWLLLYVLMVFAVIMLVDALILLPWLMKRTAKVPFWASLVAPIVLGIIIPFWGVLIAPPLLAVIYAFRHRHLSAAGQ